MRKSSLDIESCILGEIGSMGTSTVQSNSAFVDGSGGYMWASDTSFFIAFSTPATSTVRSERNGIMFYAYSPLSWGTATALGNSILFCIQSVLPEKPVPHDNACIWNLFLDQPSVGKTNSNIAIFGTALIDNTLTSIYPNIAWYRLYYTIPGESTQYPIAKIENKNIYNDTLALWNTSGMEAGAYELHLEIANSASDTIKVEAVKSVILSRGFLGINEEEPDQITVYPNPATQDITIVNNNKPTTLQLINSEGKVLRKIEISSGRVTIDVSALPAGLYQFFDLNSHTGNRGKFLKL
jgi:hypothetical protein